jgi:hypothetical protein
MSKRLRPWLTPFAIVVGTLAASTASGQTTISTITGTGPGVNGPAWNGTTSVTPWGTVASGATPTYGETFVDPAGNPLLQSMTFEIQNTSGSAIPFQAYVYNWTGTALTGSAVFASAPMTVPSAPGFQAVTVPTFSAQLVPGNQYIAMFSTIGDDGTTTGVAAWGLMQNPPGDNAYVNGTFVFNNNTTFPPLFTPNTTWTTNFNNDLAFALNFTNTSAIPEPSPLALVGLASALVGVPVLVRRRFRKAG